MLLFGGTFDPPHAAHVAMARAALRRGMPAGSWLVVVPAGRSPFKKCGARASDRDRLAMVRAAFRTVKHGAVWTDEIDRGGASYWVETLERLRRAMGAGGFDASVPVKFLMGADQAAVFHRWKRAREILGLAEPLVVLRPPVRTVRRMIRAMERGGFWTASELKEWEGRVVRCGLMDVSATAVRAGLERGLMSGAELPARVVEYIERRGLYR